SERRPLRISTSSSKSLAVELWKHSASVGMAECPTDRNAAAIALMHPYGCFARHRATGRIQDRTIRAGSLHAAGRTLCVARIIAYPSKSLCAETAPHIQQFPSIHKDLCNWFPVFADHIKYRTKRADHCQARRFETHRSRSSSTRSQSET